MSKYDVVRSREGAQPSASSGGKYADVRNRETIKQQKWEDSNQRGITAMKEAGVPNLTTALQSPAGVNPAQRQEAASRIASRPPELPGRDLPVVGPVLRALDVVEQNPIRRKAGEIAQELYTPGAGLGAINTLTRGAGNLVSRAAPGLAGSLGGRVAQTTATEAITGVPLAAAQYLAAEGDTGRADLGEATRQGLLYGGLAGGALGAAAPLLGAGVRGIQRGVQNVARAEVRPELATAVTDFMRNVERTGPDLTPSAGRAVQVPNPRAAEESYVANVLRRKEFVDDAVTGRKIPLGLPESPEAARIEANRLRRESIRQRASGTSLEPGTTPIRAPGETIYSNPDLMADYRGLPAADIAPATRARVERQVNPYRQRFEELVQRAQQNGQMRPGYEIETLDDMWSRMAGPNDPGLDELIELAYPSTGRQIPRDAVSRARELQRMRDVSGVSGPVRSLGERYSGGQLGNAAMPETIIQGSRNGGAVQAVRQNAPESIPAGLGRTAEVEVVKPGSSRTPLAARKSAMKEAQQSAQANTAPASSTGLTEGLSDFGGGLVDGMYDALWKKVIVGDITEGGTPSALLQAAKMVRDRGGLTTREKFVDLAREVTRVRSSGSTGAEYQRALREIVDRYSSDAQYMRLGADAFAPTPAAPTARQSGLRAAAQGSDSGVQNYAGNQIPFRQAATQNERTINRNRIVKNIKKNLGVTIDQGRLPTRSRGVLGVYKIQPEVVRTRMAEDIQAIAHEVGHHLDKKFKLDQPQFQRELYNLLRQNNTLNIAGYQPSQLGAEGVAEYLRLFMTDPDQAQRLAPNFTRYMDSTLDKKTMDGLLATQRDIDTWITQGDYNQAKGLIDFESGGDKEKFSFAKTYTRFMDDLNPLKIVEKTLKGSVQMGSKSLYKLARLSRGSAEWAQQAVTRGIYDAQGNKISEGLRQIVEPLEKMGVKEEDFATYLAVKHAQDLKGMGRRVPFTDEQMRAVLQKLDIPEMQAVQQGIIKYNNTLLDVLVEAQVLSRQAVNDMRKRYPNYVPFLRYFDDAAEAGFKNGGFGAAKAFANITNPLKRMSEEGSTRTILNPLESIVKNTFLAMNAASKNKVGLQLADLANIDGAGAWVEALGKGGSSPGEHVVSVFQNGERHAYKIRDPELYNAMLSLDNESSNSLIKFLGGAAGMLRAGATLTPEFTIRNAMRDIAGSMVNSTKYGFNPLDFFKGLYHVVGKTDTFEKFISSGSAMGTMQALDRQSNRDALKAVFKLSMKDKAMNIVKDPKELAKLISGYTPAKTLVGGLRKAAEVSELSTRVGAFNKTLQKTGDLQEAAYTARDLMDFQRAGSSIRQANRAVAFLNASLQGTDRMARAFKDNPASFLVRAFTTLVLPSIGLHFWNQNLPEEKKKIYDNIPQWQKDSFFIIPGPGNTFARIPKPFEAGMLFSTGTERALRWLAEDDPNAYKDYGNSVLEALAPPMLFTALTPALEAITNYSFFRKAPIVPQGEQGLEKKDQYGIYTSEVAKLIGQGLSYTPLRDSNIASPRIIDNTIRGYTAGLGQYAVSAADQGIKALAGNDGPERPAQSATELPFARSFFVSTAGGGQVREDFYDKWNDVSRAKSSADRDGKPYQSAEYQRLKMAKSAIDKLNKQYKITRDAKDVKPAEKRSRMDDLDAMINEIAAQGLGRR